MSCKFIYTFSAMYLVNTDSESRKIYTKIMLRIASYLMSDLSYNFMKNPVIRCSYMANRHGLPQINMYPRGIITCPRGET